MNKLLISSAAGGLNQLRYEVAEELGMNEELSQGWNKMSKESRIEVGRHMSKKLFERGLEEYLKQQRV